VRNFQKNKSFEELDLQLSQEEEEVSKGIKMARQNNPLFRNINTNINDLDKILAELSFDS